MNNMYSTIILVFNSILLFIFRDEVYSFVYFLRSVVLFYEESIFTNTIFRFFIYLSVMILLHSIESLLLVTFLLNRRNDNLQVETSNVYVAKRVGILGSNPATMDRESKSLFEEKLDLKAKILISSIFLVPFFGNYVSYKNSNFVDHVLFIPYSMNNISDLLEAKYKEEYRRTSKYGRSKIKSLTLVFNDGEELEFYDSFDEIEAIVQLNSPNVKIESLTK